jgi:protein SCO1/2
MKRRPKKPRQTTRRSAAVHARRGKNLFSMPLLRSACQGLLLAFLFGATAQAGGAAPERLHGLVLAVQAAGAQAVVRHDATSSMPAMTMTFALAPPAMGKRLHPGQTIDANVDRATDPWTLKDIHILGEQALTSLTDANEQPVSAIRNVTPLVVGDRLPQTPFYDEHGVPFTFASLRGNDVVLAFIYTRCADECPLISAKFGRLQTLLRGTTTRLVEVSLDPNFDTPPVLRRYAQTYGADPQTWTLLTGNLDQVLDFSARFDVSALADPRYGIIHSQRTVIVDREGFIRQLIDESAWTPAEIVSAVRAVDNQTSNPFARFNLWLSAQATAICGDRVAGFSGIGDLLVALVIFGAFGWLIYRVGRGIFAATP